MWYNYCGITKDRKVKRKNFKKGESMTNETLIALLISMATLLIGAYSGVSSVRRAARSDQRKDASELAMVIVKLEDISDGVTEIKRDINHVKGDIKELTERLIIAEQQINQANKTIDELQRRNSNE